MILRTRDARDPHRIAGLVRLGSSFSMALYAYARRRLETRTDAASAVNGFLDHIRAERIGFGHRSQRDRLRAFLLGAFQDYLDLESLRRDGVRPTTSLDFEEAESWVRSEPPTGGEPDKTFHRAWARCVLAQSCAVLKEELTGAYGAAAADMITAEVSPVGRKPFNPDLAPRLAVSPSEVLEMLRSARRRLRDLIFTTIRETVSASSDVEVEFWDLFASV